MITTPAVAYLAHAHGFAAGVVISASHNPWQDNGIKLFGPDGYKLPDATELRIEAEIFRQLEKAGEAGAGVALAGGERGGPGGVCAVSCWRRCPGLSLDNHRIVIDCANGAASAVAPQLFADLGGSARSRTLADRAQHQRGVRRAASGGGRGRGGHAQGLDWGSRSTATRTACCLPTSTARW